MGPVVRFRRKILNARSFRIDEPCFDGFEDKNYLVLVYFIVAVTCCVPRKAPNVALPQDRALFTSQKRCRRRTVPLVYTVAEKDQ